MTYWQKLISVSPQVSSFFSSSYKHTNPLDHIKNLIQEISCPRPRSSLKQKITKGPQSFSSLLWKNLMRLLLSWKNKLPVSSTGPIDQLKDLLIQDNVEKNVLIKCLSLIFGQRLLATIDKILQSLPNPVKKKDLYHLLATIGCNLTVSDLNILLEKTYTCVKTTSFQKKKKLLDLIYTPPIPEKDSSLHTESLTNSEYECYIHKLSKNAYRKPQFTEADKKLLPFAVSEQLARTIAYTSLDCEEQILPIRTFNEEHDIIYYQLKSYIKERGLYCCLFTPLAGNYPAQLVFKGTDDKDSLFRDILDPQGIGKTVFDECSPRIAEMINNYCESTKDPSLEISGHSLGGLDAQRATILCTSLIGNPELPAHYLSRISCFAFCSPKLDRATINSWEQAINTLRKTSAPPQISLNFAYHKDDVLTRIGYKYIYAPEDSFSFLEENHLLAYSKSGIFKTNTHHREPFFKEGLFSPGIDNRRYLNHNTADSASLVEKIRLLLSLIDKTPTAKTVLEKELKTIEILKQQLIQIEKEQKEIHSCQEGYSSDSSWLAFFIYKLFIVPGQHFFNLIKQEYLVDSLAHKSLVSKQTLYNWSRTYCLKV